MIGCLPQWVRSQIAAESRSCRHVLCSVRMPPVAIALVLLLLVVAHAVDRNRDLDDSSGESRRLVEGRPCVKWGNTFDVPLNSKNLLRPCSLPDGRPVCCSALSNASKIDPFTKSVGDNYHPDAQAATEDSPLRAESCTIQKVYVSSAQEIRDLQKAKDISRISDDHTSPERLQALVDYVFSDEMVRNSTRWLDRVHLHMTSSSEEQQHLNNRQLGTHSDDLEFLSRFEFTRTCGTVVEKWTEWIEPVTIAARHPFGMGGCRPVRPLISSTTPRTGRSNVDYVLLQSGRGLFDQSYHKSGRRLVLDGAAPMNSAQLRRHRYTPIQHFMLDAGTSTFDSSLYWFTCAYSQRQVGFDQVFAWEMTLLEPTDYWRRVPPQWKPYWHFYNVPIHSDIDHADSPLRFLQRMATPEDFVAFKLDIDHPDMEMPIALSLLSDDSLSSLVDEFFFELHFRCEVMTSCGWGKRVPAESHGLVLDRPNILQFFIDLRRRGIRAHIWP